MAAYAALVSVMHIIDQIEHHPRPPITLDKIQVEPLIERVTFLQEFLEGYKPNTLYDSEADPLEMRIADAAYAAEDAIESRVMDRIHGEERISSLDLYQALQRVMEDMDSLIEEAIETKERMVVQHQLQRSSSVSGDSLRSSSTRKNTTMVGFDDVLLEAMEKLTRGALDRRIIPIVGMGGIDPPSGHVVLENLQTLSSLLISECREKVVKRIPNLKTLEICCGESDRDSLHNFINLGHLQKLEHLKCRIFPSSLVPAGTHSFKEAYEGALQQNNAFLHPLKKLTLSGSELNWEDITTKIGALPHLQVLKLEVDSVVGPDWVTVEGRFCSLMFLLIDYCDDLVNWTTDETHFPRLEHLHIKHLDKLTEIPSSIGEIPTLESIDLVCCSNSANMSAKRILEEQQELGNEGLRLQINGKEASPDEDGRSE